MRIRSPIGLVLASWLIASLPSLAQASSVAPISPDSKTITLDDFNEPFLFSYLAWQNKVVVTNGVAVLRGINNQGGAGKNGQWDLTNLANYSLALRVKVNPANQAAGLHIMLKDAEDRGARWNFSFAEASADGQFHQLTPEHGAPLSRPNLVENGQMPRLDQIQQMQIIGDWKGAKAMDVELDAVRLIPPDDTITAQREALSRQEAEERERQQKTKERARAGIQHTAASPTIVHLAAAAPDILGITIQEGRLRRHDIQPYEPQPDDEFEKEKEPHPVPVWENGKIVERSADRVLVRKVGNQKTRVGYVIGGREGKLFFRPAEQVEGNRLETATVDDPESYWLVSSDDANYRKRIHPVAVHRKTKPNNRAVPNGELCLRHVVYLQLPHPVEAGKSYQIEFPGVNVSQAKVSFVHEPLKTRCESIHVNHLGYRPDDPYKRAFLSLWLGNGKAYTFRNLGRFDLIDPNGRPVFHGSIKLAMAADGTEQLRVKKNYSQTAVYHLDFSGFEQPGTYRVYIPELGCSYPFVIGDSIWREAFAGSMRGFLHQRSGIRLGPPFTDYERPRNFHPADGVKVFESTMSIPEAESGDGGWFKWLVAGRTETILPEAWGGYADAGDWDRRFQHLSASYLHLELLDLHPNYFESLKLSLPVEESGNNLPDILDEALWNVDFYRRIQREDGGVRGGVESASHPRAGEPSWMESLVVMAWAPDPLTSYTYAACAAKTARLLRPYDAARAELFARSAPRAWAWAEENFREFKDKFGSPYRKQMTNAKALAAVELLWLTQKAAYHEAFKQITSLNEPNHAPVIDEQNAVFAYARLPREWADADLQRKARAAMVATADAAIQFAEGNTFGLTTEIQQLPEIGPVGYFTTPGMISRSTPRAHFLTGEKKYLLAAVQACNFSLGANPDNMTFTTGIGHEYPRAPLHIDSRVNNQAPPQGLTLYGVSDPARGDPASEWVHIWWIGKDSVPNSRTWPATEAYVDVYMWPMMNEYTVHQNLGPTSYYWGYLAARK